MIIRMKHVGIGAAIFLIEEERRLSALFDRSQIQASFCFRSQRRSLLLAERLIDEKGELKEGELKILIQLLKEEGHSLYAEGDFDALLLEHQLNILNKLQLSSSFYKKIKQFRKPLCHRSAEALICDSLGIALPISDRDIRCAVLSACLTLLRQNVGSCFATAPAILMQHQQIDQLIDDLYELLSTGKLKRTFGGVEYIVPLSPSWGMGDLKKPFFLNDITLDIYASPGLMAAFKCRAREDLENLLTPYFKKKEKWTAEELIKGVLLDQIGIQPSDLKENLGAENNPFYLSKSSLKKRELIELFREREKEAKTAFKRMTDHALLKAWEFTLASFSEVKMDFSKWNLYASLGFDVAEKSGIGEIFYRYLQQKLEENNQKIEAAQNEYLIAYDQLRATEILLGNASSESEARRLRAEHQSRYYHMQSCLDRRNEIHSNASHYTNFFNFLIDRYSQKFPEYFQEIYDAEMQDFTGNQYDDSPAGFRLIYKYGRSDASVWQLVRSADQWIEVLIDFFKAVELDMISQCESEVAKEDVRYLTTAIITHVRTQEFLENAILRMGKAHKMGLISFKDLEKIEKKPWAYTSGGSMDILINSYFKREGELSRESRKVESTTDLLIFLLDLFKQLPPSITNSFLKNRTQGMLMQSPTHAFILYPGLDLFKQGWEESGFTYTWVRDSFLYPREAFFKSIILSPSEQRFLIDRFSYFLSPMEAHHCQKQLGTLSHHLSLQDFREKIAEACFNSALWDHFLYESLPLTSYGDASERLMQLTETKSDLIFSFPFAAYLTRRELEEAAVAVLIEKGVSFDIREGIAKRSAALQFAPPRPLLFADTNWVGYYFAFVVNPGHGQLELWRMDRTGSTGFPMTSWRSFLDGSTHLPWTVFTHPHQYSSIM